MIIDNLTISGALMALTLVIVVLYVFNHNPFNGDQD